MNSNNNPVFSGTFPWYIKSKSLGTPAHGSTARDVVDVETVDCDVELVICEVLSVVPVTVDAELTVVWLDDVIAFVDLVDVSVLLVIEVID